MLAVALAAAAAALAVAVPSRPRPAPPAQRARSSSLESSVLVDINAFRAQHELAAAAAERAAHARRARALRQMAPHGYFAHESADGSAFWSGSQRFYAASPWQFWSVGENLLWSSPDVDAARAR